MATLIKQQLVANCHFVAGENNSSSRVNFIVDMKFLFLVIIVFVLPVSGWAADVKEITPLQVYGLIKEGSGLWFIDVRSEISFRKGHAEGAVNIPLGTLSHKRFPPEKILITVDNSLGQVLSRQAAKILENNGQKRVYILKGGLGGWRRQGLPMVAVGDPWEIVRVFQQELFDAQQQGVELQVYDLRSEDELNQGIITGSVVLSGESLENRLIDLRRQLQQQHNFTNLAAKLRWDPVNLVVFPASVSARDFYMEYLWGLPGDLRVLEGGYAAWDAVQRKGVVRTGKGCATCPGT